MGYTKQRAYKSKQGKSHQVPVLSPYMFCGKKLCQGDQRIHFVQNLSAAIRTGTVQSKFSDPLEEAFTAKHVGAL